jgi:hypothetical protein
MKIDYLIIGAGQAGLVLKRFLTEGRSVLLDPNPGGYKIGESVVPEQFAHPVMRALVPRVRELPSFAPKFGTTFVCDDSVASFPLPPTEAALSMHVARSELEQLMAREWGTEITRERVVEIDLAKKTVRTDKQTYEVERQIIDCSGPAMVVGSALGEVSSLWPVYAAWGYFDVLSSSDDRFWEALRSHGKKYLRYDAPRRKIIPGSEIDGWSPSRATILTRLRDGVWTWQIPLFGSKLLSFGVVSRHAPISTDELLAIAAETRSANYTLAPRPQDGSSHYNRIYTREGFARRARVGATMDYILLADAFAFADPVYSVGTALAVNKAIELAGVLNGHGWTEERRAAWCETADDLLARAIKAFDFWYSGEVLSNDEAAAEVRDNFLVGNAFQVAAAQNYGGMVRDASLDRTPLRERDVSEIEWVDDAQKGPFEALLGAGAGATLMGFRLSGAGQLSNGFKFRWESEGRPELTVVVIAGGDPTAKAYKRSGGLAISFMNLKDRSYPFDAKVAALLDALLDRMGRREKEWLAMLEKERERDAPAAAAAAAQGGPIS